MMSGIRVSWLPDECKEKDIKIYFSKNEHGGGPIQRIYYPMFNGDAVVIFTDPDTADTVTSIEEHMMFDKHSVGVTKLPTVEVFPKLEAKLDPTVAALLQADVGFREEIQFHFYHDNVEFVTNKDGDIEGIRGNWYLLEWTWAHIDNFIKSQNGAKFDQSLIKVDPFKSTRSLGGRSQREVYSERRQEDEPMISLSSAESVRMQTGEVVRQKKRSPRLHDDDGVEKHKFNDDRNDDDTDDDDSIDKHVDDDKNDNTDDKSGDNRVDDDDDDEAGYRAEGDPRSSPVNRMTSNAKIDIKSSKGDVNILEFTYGQINVGIFVGLITLAETDAIVNAVNGSLAHGGGVAYAISQAAGQMMKKECDAYIAKHRMLGDGEVMHTSAGGKLNGKVKYIMHTVGPMWLSTRETNCCADLMRAFLNCLKYANDHLKIKSITFPLISSGVFGMPVELCAKSFMYALMMLQEECDTVSLREVHLVNKDTSHTALTITQLQHMIPQGPETLIAEAKLLQESVSVSYKKHLRAARYTDDYKSLPLDLGRNTLSTTRQLDTESSITKVRGQKLQPEMSSGAMGVDTAMYKSLKEKRTSPPKTSYSYETYGHSGLGTSLASLSMYSKRSGQPESLATSTSSRTAGRPLPDPPKDVKPYTSGRK